MESAVALVARHGDSDPLAAILHGSAITPIRRQFTTQAAMQVATTAAFACSVVEPHSSAGLTLLLPVVPNRRWSGLLRLSFRWPHCSAVSSTMLGSLGSGWLGFGRKTLSSSSSF